MSFFQILLPKHNLTRDDIFLTTKLHPTSENCYEETERRVNESLELLKTDYIDMYLIHYPKPNNCENDDPKNAEYRKLAYSALEKCKDAGKIRSVGVSSYEINHLEELKSYSKEPPCANQVEYHPHFTREDLKKYCEEHGIFFQAFSSLARHNEDLLNHPSVVEMAEKYKIGKTTLLLSWAVSQNVGVIPKSSNPERILENITKLVKMDPEDVEVLGKLDKRQHYVRTTGWLVK